MRARGCEIAQPMCKLAASSHGCNKVVPSRARELASSRDETICPQRGELAICELAICEIIYSRRGELAICELTMCEIACSRRGELAMCEIARLNSRDCGGDGIVPGTH